MRVIELAGDPQQIGRAHGEELRNEIEETVSIYRNVLGLSERAETAHGARIERTIRSFDEGLADEIEAIAAGAGQPTSAIFVLNGRSELMGAATDACTTMHMPSAGLLGQTWDWIDLLEPLVVVLRVRPNDAPAYVTMTEPGIAAKIGCNEAGVGVTLNFLYAPGPLNGVPIHALLRALLTCRTADDATRVVLRAGHGRAGAVHVAGSDGWGMSVEHLGHRTIRQLTRDEPHAHTNHSPLDPLSGGELLDNSTARLERAAQLLHATPPDTPASMLGALADRQGDHPICARYVSFGPVNVGTVATVVMDLRGRRLHVRVGPDADAAAVLVVDIGGQRGLVPHEFELT
jgi:isopenicillin-N N-acyltransferase like protein